MKVKITKVSNENNWDKDFLNEIFEVKTYTFNARYWKVKNSNRLILKENSEKIKTSMNTDTILCKCGSPDHKIIIRTDNDEENPIVYLNIHLNKQSFFKRFLNGIKYILGYGLSKHGDYDEFIFDKKHVEKIEKIIEKIKS